MLALDGKERPFPGHTLQCPVASVLELDVGSRHQQGHGARDPDLARVGILHDPRCDMHPDTTDVGPAYLDLTGVNTSADLHSEGAQSVTKRLRALHSTTGTVEGGEDAVTGELDEPPSMESTTPPAIVSWLSNSVRQRRSPSAAAR